MSTDHNFTRERRTEADLNIGPAAYQPNALPLMVPVDVKHHVYLLTLIPLLPLLPVPNKPYGFCGR